MSRPKKILIVSEIGFKPVKMFLEPTMKMAKGFIRLGNDVRILSYSQALRSVSLFKTKRYLKFFKPGADKLLHAQVKNYKPDIVYMTFPRLFDEKSVDSIRKAHSEAIIFGWDCDPWPAIHKHPKFPIARKLDYLIATNNGQFLEDYKKTGVENCIFMPNCCDPDLEYKYDVSSEFKSDILWTGSVGHSGHENDNCRKEIIDEISNRPDVAIYGCLGNKQIGGLNYLYAISGTKIGVSINAVNDIYMYHSDRITNYLACGAFVLAKNVPGSERMFENEKHLVYFDTKEDFKDKVNFYLKNDQIREKIAKQGQEHIHKEYNSTKIAGYILDIAKTGKYNAYWNK